MSKLFLSDAEEVSYCEGQSDDVIESYKLNMGSEIEQLGKDSASELSGLELLTCKLNAISKVYNKLKVKVDKYSASNVPKKRYLSKKSTRTSKVKDAASYSPELLEILDGINAIDDDEYVDKLLPKPK